MAILKIYWSKAVNQRTFFCCFLFTIFASGKQFCFFVRHTHTSRITDKRQWRRKCMYNLRRRRRLTSECVDTEQWKKSHFCVGILSFQRTSVRTCYLKFKNTRKWIARAENNKQRQVVSSIDNRFCGIVCRGAVQIIWASLPLAILISLLCLQSRWPTMYRSMCVRLCACERVLYIVTYSGRYWREHLLFHHQSTVDRPVVCIRNF